jgi:hypothetical protein
MRDFEDSFVALFSFVELAAFIFVEDFREGLRLQD